MAGFGNRRTMPRTVLYIGGSASEPTGSNDDTHLIADFRAQGWTVTYMDDDVVSAGDAAGKNAVYISESVSSAAIGSTFLNTAVPIVLSEGFILDDMNMASTPGTWFDDEITIRSPIHPMSNFLTGAQAIQTTAGTGTLAGSGTWGPGARFFANEVGTSSNITLAWYEKGATGISSFVMPERRVFFGCNVSDSAVELSSIGRTINVLCMQWAMSIPMVGR